MLATLAVFLVAAGAAAYSWLLASLPQRYGVVALPGLDADVEVIRDMRGVPHVFAGSERDAFAALGFLHAQDRLAQMDFMRLLARGRLSEVVGRAALDTDRLMRAYDLEREARRTLEALDPRWVALLEAYAGGVNAHLRQPSALPPELGLLGRTPEPWRPVDSLLWGKLMAIQLSGNWRDELLRARLSRTLEPALLSLLWPEWPADASTTLAGVGAEALDRLLAALPPPPGPRQASNEWVLSGERTASGKPLLANDPHLGLGAPGQWYLVRIETPTLTLAGATAPGVPGVVLGHNDQIAWGFTTTNVDAHDLFIETISPEDPTRYLTESGSDPFTVRTERIAIKGEDAVEVTIRGTRHGVVISDAFQPAGRIAGDRQVVALASPSGYVLDRTPAALFALNRAATWDAFVDALRDWHMPMQNIVYADRTGQIGFYSPGRVPIRSAGSGWMPSAGTDEQGWTGFVPFDELPQARMPKAGYFANANNRVVPESYPHFITRDWDAPYRARRIDEMLQARPTHDVRSMADIQLDDVSLFAREVIPQLGRFRPGDSRAAAALERLRGWDGRMSRARPEPLIFTAWMRRFVAAVLEDELMENLPLVLGERPALILAGLRGQLGACDDIRTAETETCASQFERALEQAVTALTAAHGGDMGRWRWGDVHVAPFRHPVLARIPLVGDWLALRVPTPGDYYTINRGATRLADPVSPYAHVHGAGLRAIYDLADPGASLFMIAPGQSGHPLSPHWSDLAHPWADGAYFSLARDRAALRADGARLILRPSS